MIVMVMVKGRRKEGEGQACFGNEGGGKGGREGGRREEGEKREGT